MTRPEDSTRTTRHLWSLIALHQQTYGTSTTELARQIGVTRQTLSAWRSDGLKGRLPTRETLDAVAQAINRPRRQVLDAALHDAGYLDSTTGTRDYDDILADVTAALTEAVSLTHTRSDGSSGNRIDWAAMLCQAVAAVAANTGGTEYVLQGRPGSWEADHVRTLLRWTVGEGDEFLMNHRTAPIEVNLNPEHVLDFLAPTVVDSYLDTDLDDEARDALDARYEELLTGYGDRLAGAITDSLRALNSQMPIAVHVGRDVEHSDEIPDPDDRQFRDNPIEKAIAEALALTPIPPPFSPSPSDG